MQAVPLAIFDLDNTLLGGDSDHAWGEFLVSEGWVDAERFRASNDLFYQRYLNGDLDIFEYQAFALAPLKEMGRAMAEQLRARFLTERIAPLILPKGLALLEQHRRRGDFLLIITATSHFITEPIASQLAVDDLIATMPELADGEFTGRVAGVPSFREGKVARLRQWLDERALSLDGSSFYSDSHNDLPLLSLVENPVAVDPDPLLEAHARGASWPVISLR
jgi:HAD superfamily hydrolase (TIGR01490 family)